MSESTLVRQLLLAYNRGPVRLFRNNSGVLQDRRGAWVRYGLCPGSSDLIGWKCGVFVAIECKSKGKRPTPEQVAFLGAVRSAGGIAGVVYSLEDTVLLLGPPP